MTRLLEAADPAAREAAWKSFLEAHSRLLLYTARKLDRDYDATMDAYAHLLEQLRHNDFQRLRTYLHDGRSKFTTWLVVVARRLCLDRLRQRYGRAPDFGPAGRDARQVRRRLVDLLGEELDTAELVDPAGGDAETQLRAQELSHSLAGVLADLEPRDQLLLKLRFEDGVPAREIAQVMRFATPFHVYRRINSLLGRLRVALARRGVLGSEP